MVECFESSSDFLLCPSHLCPTSLETSISLHQRHFLNSAAQEDQQIEMESDTNDARPAMHHLSLHAEQYLSQSQIIQRLEGLETSTLATLTLSYAELKDVKTIGILDWLSQAGRKSVQPRWICKAIFDHFNSLHPQSESDQDGASNDPEPEMISFTPRLPSLPHYTPSTYPIRKLDLTSNNITSKGLDSISDYLAYNSCINILSLQANSIGVSKSTRHAFS